MGAAGTATANPLTVAGPFGIELVQHPIQNPLGQTQSQEKFGGIVSVKRSGANLATAKVTLNDVPLTYTALRLCRRVPLSRQQTNEDQAEQVWRRSLAQLPPRGACLAALMPRDRPEPGKVQRAVPAYLLRPPHREVQLLSVDAWLRSPPPCPAGAFLLLDPRCYAIYHRPMGLAPLLPGCAAALQHAQPIDAWTLPNLGDNEYGYYADVKEFQVGLYRLQPRR